MQEEIDRLRALVGPDEASYATLSADLAAAADDARAREHEMGELRAKVLLLERQLRRSERRNYVLSQWARLGRGVGRGVRRVVGAARR